MALSFTPRINGFEYSWANIIVTALGIPLSNLTKIDYTYSQAMTSNPGWMTQPVSYSYGNVTYQVSIEMYLSTWNDICAAAPFGDPCKIPPFQITVAYGNFDQAAVAIYEDILYDVQFMSHTRTPSQGEMGLKVTVNCMVSAISYNN